MSILINFFMALGNWIFVTISSIRFSFFLELKFKVFILYEIVVIIFVSEERVMW
jgi:hypothetical protein